VFCQFCSQFLGFTYNEVKGKDGYLSRQPIQIFHTTAHDDSIFRGFQNAEYVEHFLLRRVDIGLEQELECKFTRQSGDGLHDVGQWIKTLRALKMRIEGIDMSDTVQPKGTQILAQMTVSDPIPFVKIISQAIWIEIALSILALIRMISNVDTLLQLRGTTHCAEYCLAGWRG
jgi:hypothetical protein